MKYIYQILIVLFFAIQPPLFGAGLQEDMRELNVLKKNGLITDEEFSSLKKDLLSDFSGRTLVRISKSGGNNSLASVALDNTEEPEFKKESIEFESLEKDRQRIVDHQTKGTIYENLKWNGLNIRIQANIEGVIDEDGHTAFIWNYRAKIYDPSTKIFFGKGTKKAEFEFNTIHEGRTQFAWKGKTVKLQAGRKKSAPVIRERNGNRVTNHIVFSEYD